ncbi:hypothetical protein ABT120_16190 [Nonomuraea angiospora]|uniref:hypothetical protein n=1 Tax=Nonomuraea angiospora TaxID=46172 RepID=UPI00331BEA6B
MMRWTYEAECWLTSSARPRLSSIHGTGLFAIKRIRQDEVVMRLGGRVIGDETLARLTPPYSSLTGVEAWSMACRCDTPLCRRVVTGHDWRLSRLQAAYGTHWSPPLLERIEATSVVGDQPE